MKKQLLNAVLIFGATAVGYAQVSSQTSEHHASNATQIRKSSTLSASSSDATAKFENDSNAEAIRAEKSRIVLTNEQVDAAIIKVEQQMVENEGKEGFLREDYLKKIAVLNKRRPTSSTPQ
ncbi:MAG: hypothetical protein K9G46_02325 [Flavobacteriales bacterium]|nr:hypothetical protein [Flavobacteriales bacterium]